MNFNDKKTKRMIAIVTMVVIVAMIATSIIPYLMGQGEEGYGTKNRGGTVCNRKRHGMRRVQRDRDICAGGGGQ